jgi:hypothetical protein
LCGCKAGKCIWQHNGIFLPCRNDLGKYRCECDKRCFGKSFNSFIAMILITLFLEPLNKSLL